MNKILRYTNKEEARKVLQLVFPLSFDSNGSIIVKNIIDGIDLLINTKYCDIKHVCYSLGYRKHAIHINE